MSSSEVVVIQPAGQRCDEFKKFLKTIDKEVPAELTTKKLRRGVHRSTRQLNADIRDWIEHWNEEPKPFVWTKTADQILESLAAVTAHESTTQDISLDPPFSPRRV